MNVLYEHLDGLKNNCIWAMKHYGRFCTIENDYEGTVCYIDSIAFRISQIGEDVSKIHKNYPEFIKNTQDEISWDKIRGMRNRIVHDYENIDVNVLIQVMEEEVPDLLDFCEKKIAEEEQKLHPQNFEPMGP